MPKQPSAGKPAKKPAKKKATPKRKLGVFADFGRYGVGRI